MKKLNLITYKFLAVLIFTALFASYVRANDIPKPPTIAWIEKVLSDKTERQWLPIAKDNKSETFIAPSSITYFSDPETLDILRSINIIEKKSETSNYIMGTAIYNCDNKTFKLKDIKVFDLSGNIRSFEDTEFTSLKNHEKNERIADFICPKIDNLPIF